MTLPIAIAVVDLLVVTILIALRVEVRLVLIAASVPLFTASSGLKAMCLKLVTVRPVLDRVPNFRSLLAEELPEEAAMELRRAETIGRPLGDESFFDDLERQLGSDVRPQRRGRKPKAPLQENA